MPSTSEQRESAELADLIAREISFATPFADVMGPRFAADIEEITTSTSRQSTTLSFSSPESDFVAPSELEIQNSTLRAIEVGSNFSFAGAESDFCAPTLHEMNECAERANEVNARFSFASPESDFTAPLLRIMHEDLPITRDAALEASSQARVITSAIPPFQILSVNDAWIGLCGFDISESRAKTLNLLQGPETDNDIIRRISETANAGLAQEAVLTNYRKNGEKFKNRLKIQPLDDGTMLGVLEEVNINESEKHVSLGYM